MSQETKRREIIDGVNAVFYSIFLIFGMLTLQIILASAIVSALAYICYGIVAAIILGWMYRKSTKNDIFHTSHEPVSISMIKNLLLLIVISFFAALFFDSMLKLVWLISSDFSILDKTVNDYTELMKELDGTRTYLMLFYTLLLAPVVEELAFRGLILRKLEKVFGIKTAVFIQAFLFGLVHFQVIQSTYTFLAGIIFGYIMYKRKSILQLILVHILFNIFGAFVVSDMIDALASLTGMAAAGIIVCAAAAVVLAVSLWKSDARDNLYEENLPVNDKESTVQ